MKIQFLSLYALFSAMLLSCGAQTLDKSDDGGFSRKIIINGLDDPWDIIYGPDKQLWVTESKSYLVSRINPDDGSKKVLLDVSKQKSFSGWPWPQGGLMGMALHPDLLNGKPYVYLAYVYRFNGSKPNFGGHYFTTKIVRFSYNQQAQTLDKPVIICDTIPGSSDHNSGRLLIAPINGKNYLFYTVGDMGAGQFDNAGRPNHAQDKQSYEGKILRFNIEPDADSDSVACWIPDDNPFNEKQQNAVWSLGHRNAQGLAWAMINNTPIIYSSEHGPFSDDELNIIEKGKNYGHPLIIGYNDNNYNGLAAGVTDHPQLPGIWHTTYPLIVSEHENAKKIGVDYMDPLKVFYPNDSERLKKVFETWGQGGWTDWPSEAPSSIAVYTSDAIPGWKNSLLIPTLKGGKLIRVKLSDDGQKTIEEDHYFKSSNRYRDIDISPDGRKIYLITDKSSVTSGPTFYKSQTSTERGAILEFTWINSKK